MLCKQILLLPLYLCGGWKLGNRKSVSLPKAPYRRVLRNALLNFWVNNDFKNKCF